LFLFRQKKTKEKVMGRIKRQAYDHTPVYYIWRNEKYYIGETPLYKDGNQIVYYIGNNPKIYEKDKPPTITAASTVPPSTKISAKHKLRIFVVLILLFILITILFLSLIPVFMRL
jgi:hypothetical protein